MQSLVAQGLTGVNGAVWGVTALQGLKCLLIPATLKARRGAGGLAARGGAPSAQGGGRGGDRRGSGKVGEVVEGGKRR